jgi:hypothetical protein
MAAKPHIARWRGFAYEIAEAAGCAGQAHLANLLCKSLKKHNRTEAHIAPLYPAIVRSCCPASPATHSMMR